MNADTLESARAACEKLSRAHGELADAWNADAFAQLFTEDGVFNRLGTEIRGRAALRDFLANRPRDTVQKHHASNFTFQLAADGSSATGTLDLELQQYLPGADAPHKTIHARYLDQFALTDEGWRIRYREVVLVDPKK